VWSASAYLDRLPFMLSDLVLFVAVGFAAHWACLPEPRPGRFGISLRQSIVNH
jgi:hypothetical protein